MNADKFGKAFLRDVGFKAGCLNIVADAFENLPFRHSISKSRIKRLLTSNMFDVNKGPMKTDMMFLRRLGPDPHENGAQTIALRGCPDVWLLNDGNFAVIGIDITDTAAAKLPPTAGCGPDERIVLVPRKTLVLAKADIPDRI